MTQEEKAKAYDEALKVLHKYDGANIMFSQSLKEEMFPELAESEDERMRKEMIEIIRKEAKEFPSSIIAENASSWIAWLEKQASPVLSNSSSVGKDDNKVEPKFHEGEWLVNVEYGNVVRVLKVLEDNYRLDFDGDTIGTLCTELVDSDYRLWNIIQDAKDGDVLVDRYGNIGIFEKTFWFDWHSYCYLGCNGDFMYNEIGGSHDLIDTYPATKEQRDLLFQKMHESGYEWDAEKKELKKIDNEEIDGEDYGIDGLWHAQRILEKTLGSVDGYQSDDGILEHKAAITAVKKLYGQNPAWSEEDEVKINRIVACLENLNVADNDILLKDISWLKSLKDRVLPHIDKV